MGLKSQLNLLRIRDSDRGRLLAGSEVGTYSMAYGIRPRRRLPSWVLWDASTNSRFETVRFPKWKVALPQLSNC